MQKFSSYCVVGKKEDRLVGYITNNPLSRGDFELVQEIQEKAKSDHIQPVVYLIENSGSLSVHQRAYILHKAFPGMELRKGTPETFFRTSVDQDTRFVMECADVMSFSRFDRMLPDLISFKDKSDLLILIDRNRAGLSESSILGGTTPSLVELTGKHSDKTWEEIEKEIEKGTIVEKEHTPNEHIAREIAIDHIWEMFDYYDKLKKMESDNLKECNSLSGLILELKDNGYYPVTAGYYPIDWFNPEEVRLAVECMEGTVLKYRKKIKQTILTMKNGKILTNR